MTFNPKLSVTAGLDNLAPRLETIIRDRFPVELGGKPWSVVLVELDRIEGRKPREYRTNDLQAQLYMLTRRLGGLGFPYDYDHRTVSTLGSELRIVRNAWAHGEVLATLDAWRAHDYCVRLLDYFGDEAGAAQAARLRDEALAAYVAEKQIAPSPVATTMADDADEPVSVVVDEDDEADEEDVQPDEEVFEQAQVQSDPPVVLEPRREPWQAWTPVPVGDPEELDHMRKADVKDKVRAVVWDIADAEGPVHLERVITLTARAFRVRKLSKKRRKSIEYQVRKNSGLHFDNHQFLWPEGVDPQAWVEFRPNASTAGRKFEHISPVEVANAMRFLTERHPEYDQEELRRATLRTFGRVRMTAGCKAQLKAAERRFR